MSIWEKVDIDLRNAIYSQDKILLNTIRLIKAKLVEVAKSEKGNGGVSDEEAVTALRKMVKQRKESAKIYADQSRPDLEKVELLEIDVIVKYLPLEMTDAELRKKVLEVIAQSEARKIADLGILMRDANLKLKGQVDGARLSEVTKTMFLAYLKMKGE